jgi:hypothetical protein
LSACAVLVLADWLAGWLAACRIPVGREGLKELMRRKRRRLDGGWSVGGGAAERCRSRSRSRSRSKSKHEDDGRREGEEGTSKNDGRLEAAVLKLLPGVGWQTGRAVRDFFFFFLFFSFVQGPEAVNKQGGKGR